MCQVPILDKMSLFENPGQLFQRKKTDIFIRCTGLVSTNRPDLQLDCRKAIISFHQQYFSQQIKEKNTLQPNNSYGQQLIKSTLNATLFKFLHDSTEFFSGITNKQPFIVGDSKLKQYSLKNTINNYDIILIFISHCGM